MKNNKNFASSVSDLYRRVMANRFFSILLPVIFLGLMVLFFARATDGRFILPASLKIILDRSLTVAAVSTGATFIFATGNTNLAMGATTVLTATIACMIYESTQNLVLTIVAAILIGVFIMAVSAILSTIFRVRVMYVTIVMMSLLSALQQTILGGRTVSIPYEVTSMLTDNSFHYIAFALYFIVAVILFHFTAIGRSLKMMGTNELCAEQTGISKSKYLLIAFLIAGVGCGIGSLIAIVRGGSVGANTLTSLNMDCMLALVLGGMSIFGGSKSAAFAGVIGAITVVVLNQGLTMLRVDTAIVQGIRGVAFLILVSMGQKRPQGLPAPEG